MSSISVALIQFVQFKSVAAPVRAPINVVAVSASVDALYESPASVLDPSEPAASVAMIPTAKCVLVAQSAGSDASAVAVDALPVSAPINVVVVSASVVALY